jgi:hypothetical protein
MKGEISVTAQADLAGLGASQGPALSWTVPVGFAEATSPGLIPPVPAAPSTGTDFGPWVILLALLALALFLASRKPARR